MRDGLGKVGQFCIDLKLAQALRGDVERGLFFRGAGKLPFGQAIRPVRELMHYLLTGEKTFAESQSQSQSQSQEPAVAG